VDRGRIVVVSASVGAGHDGPAAELTRRLREGGWRVDRVDCLDVLPIGLGGWLRDRYLTQVRVAPRSWGWLLGSVGGTGVASRLVHRLIDLTLGRMSTALGGRADVVVSTFPLASQVLGRLRISGQLDCPVVTFLTDMSVHPLWVHPGVDHHLALHAVPAGQARRLGAGDVHISAPAVAPAFTIPPMTIAAREQHRERARQRFALPALGTVALVTAGSSGVGDVLATARDLAEIGVLPVVLCAGNTTLRRRLEHAGLGRALAWIDDVPELLGACDVVIQNAGGLASVEAMIAGRPVLSYRNLPGHGSANAAALQEAGLARWVRNRHGLAAAVEEAVNRPSDGEPAAVDVLLGQREPATVITALANPPSPVEAVRSSAHRHHGLVPVAAAADEVLR